jgi:hypothetical protein
MENQPRLPDSILTCVNGLDGTVLKAGTASRMIGPSSVDPLHLMLGAACGDWGVCIYLNLADAARLKTDLDRLLTEHAERG